MKEIVTLIVLDGWGIGANNETNPIYKANLKTIPFIESNFPSGAIQASGLAVGLPYYEEGNSELGHLTLGAGRIVENYAHMILKRMEDGSFFQSDSFLSLIEWVKKHNSKLNLVGLLTEGEVHASLKHLKLILDFFKKNGFENYVLHLISDGRDSSPHSFLPLVDELSRFLKFDVKEKIVTLCGRYYAMDRDKHWDRTEKAYKALIGEGEVIDSIDDAIFRTYNENLNDEYVGCYSLKGKQFISDNDAVLFFNFREDRMRQIVSAFVKSDFRYFPTKKFSNLLVVSMTKYERNFENPVLFSPPPLEQTLGEVLSSHNKIQLRIAETEKYAHVTYFFSGLREEPFPLEYRILVPSKNVFRYNEYPEMMAKTITDRVISGIAEGTYDFILVNYANPDMVAHTGDFEATKKAVEIVDEELGRIIKLVLDLGHICIITADHGNAEVLLDNKGEIETKHDPNPVPFYLVAKKFQRKSSLPIRKLPNIGMLQDVAPTILEIMKISQPTLMTGQSLLSELLEY